MGERKSLMELEFVFRRVAFLSIDSRFLHNESKYNIEGNYCCGMTNYRYAR